MSRRKREEPAQPIRNEDPWADRAVAAQVEDHAAGRDRARWMKKDQRMREREAFDAYRNELTGIGDYLRDKTFGGRQTGPDLIVRFLSNVDHENRWRGSDLGGRIVECVPDEMTREGFDVVVQPSEGDDEPDDAAPDEATALDRKDLFPGQDPGAAPGAPPFGGGGIPTEKPEMSLPEIDDEAQEISEKVEGKLDELGALDVLWEALCYKRAFGGGAILIGADDGAKDLTEPLDEKRIRSINWLNALSGGREGELVAWSYYRDPRSPKYGMPEVYMLRNLGVPIAKVPAPGENVAADPLPATAGPAGMGPLVYWVHESRLLVFSGTAVSRRARVQMRGWGDSVFTRVDEVLSHYGQTWGGVANLLTDFAQGVLAIEGLAEKFSSNNRTSKGSPLQTRVLQMQMMRSLARMLLVDKNEDFKREATPLSGIAEILQQFALRLAAAADMPVSLLMGQAPAGLNATGASDIRFFYDRIAARQRKDLLPQLKKLVRLIFLSKEGPTDGVEPEKWNIKFRSLYQMTEMEEAQLRKTVAETDQIYVNLGVLDAAEVTAGAFGGSMWSMERQIDFEGRKKLAEAEAADREARNAALMKAAQTTPDPGGGAPGSGGGAPPIGSESAKGGGKELPTKTAAKAPDEGGLQD